MDSGSRSGLFKAHISSDLAREKRADVSCRLRKARAEEQLSKRRNVGPGAAAAAAAPQMPTGDESNLIMNQTQLTDLIKLREQALSSNPAERLAAVKIIRQRLSIQTSPPINEVIEAGLVPYLISFLDIDNDPVLQLESAWSLTNIASGTSKQTAIVIENDSIPRFIRLLSASRSEVREQAIWALGNIAGDDVRCRDLVLQSGGLQPLLQQYQLPNPLVSLLRNATWTLSNFCRGKPTPQAELIQDALPVLAQLIQSGDQDIVIDACWALSYLSDDDHAAIQRVIDSGVTPTLVQMLEHQHYLVQTPAIRCIGNFISGTDEQTMTTLSCGALTALVKLLDHARPTIVNEACWTLSNVAAGTVDQVNALLQTNCMPRIIDLMKNSAYDTQKETAWTIFNITSSHRVEIVDHLIRNDVLDGLLPLLKKTDIELKDVTLRALENILKTGRIIQEQRRMEINPYALQVIDKGYANTITDLQDHKDINISERVSKIIRSYFPFKVDEVDEDMVYGNITSFN